MERRTDRNGYIGQWSPILAPETGFPIDNFSSDRSGGRDGFSFQFHPLLTSCYEALFLTGHGLVCSLGVGDLCFKRLFREVEHQGWFRWNSVN